MRQQLFIYLILTTMAAEAEAQKVYSPSAISKMHEAELSFAEMSISKGRQVAFATFLDEKALIFTDKWINNGGEFWKNRPSSPAILRWEPEYMIISASGDFGVSTGFWDLYSKKPGTGSVSNGHFLSVWKRNSDGTWKVILDGGTTSPPNTGHLQEFKSVILSENVSGNKNESPEVIEHQMLDELKSGKLQTYLSMHSDSSLVLLEGQYPPISGDSFKKWLANSNGLTWEIYSSGVASSGDLAYTCGVLNTGKAGHYVRIWTHDNKSGWKIIIEALVP